MSEGTWRTKVTILTSLLCFVKCQFHDRRTYPTMVYPLYTSYFILLIVRLKVTGKRHKDWKL